MPPIPPQVQRLIRQQIRLDVQRRIANDQRRIAFRQHLRQDGFHRPELRLATVLLSQQDMCQRHRTPRTRIDRQRADFTIRPLRDQQNTPHGSFAGDAQIRKIIQTQPVQLGARHKADRRRAGFERLRAIGGQIEPEVELSLPGAVQKAPNQGPGIEITYRGDTQETSLSDPIFPSPGIATLALNRSLRAMLLLRGRFTPACRLPVMRPFRLSVLLLPVFLSSLTAQITLNSQPTRVIGQLSTTVTSLSPNLVEGREFEAPESVVVDASSSPSPLYVADTGNNRILGFRNAASFTNGQFADIVIGQPDLVTTFQQGPGAGTTRTTGLSIPEGMAVDASGNLYVIDAGNNRILRFPRPFAQAATVFPDLVIGQPDFTTGASNQGGLSASSLSFVVSSSALTAALAFDGAGNLWVTDAGNNRILRFNVSGLGAQPKSGPSADVVLGQINFTTNTEGTTVPPLTSLTSIFEPAGIAFDPSGRLFVLESVSSRQGRVLVWFPGSSGFVTGQTATRMLGIYNGTPAPPPISQFQFGLSPGALFTVGTQIGVADTANSRLLIFPPVEQWNTNNFYQAAATVIGQTDFNSGLPNQNQQLAGPSTLAHPAGTFFFNSSLYVADAGNSRMIVFPQNGATYGPATSVLGQPQLTLNSVNYIEGRELNFSAGADAGVAVDFTSAVPHLYISDTYNNRILGYYDLRNIKPGQYADIVIGQPDFLHSVSDYPNNQPSSSNLSVPTGLAVDSNGNLYVADSGNGRVVRFPAPFANFTPGTPMAVTESADLLLGQISFTTKITDPTSQTMGAPYGLAFTSNGSLLASDLGNNRVLFFPATGGVLTSGEAATIVFGQSNMSSNIAGSGLNQMSFPHHIAVDSDDRLYVADTNNGRVLIFNRAPAASNGPYAALTLTSGLSGPRGLDVNLSTGDIWVADPLANAAIRFPNFNNLIGSGNYKPNATLVDVQPLAVAEDNWGNLFLADNTNRVAIFYPGLSVVNAANYWGYDTNPQFPMAPGVIAAMYSTGNTGQFGTASVSAPAGVLPLPQTLNGIQVLVNSTPAPLFYAGTDQINFEFPSSSPQSGGADVQVIDTATGRVLGDTTVAMAAVSPGIFTQNALGSGAGIIINKDGTLNTSANPATAGDYVSIYMTGQGYITGMPPDGNVSNAALSTPYTPLVFIVGAHPPSGG